VLDPFVGSGTTPAVAQKLGRRWVGCDAGYGAVQTTRRRLQAVTAAQAAADGAPPPAFVLYTWPHTATSGPSAPFQARLAIAPIDGAATRIRVTVEHVSWPDVHGQQHGTEDGPWPHDWREAIDAIAIDGAYDGVTLRVTLADAPLKRAQLVAGTYELAAPPPPAQVAVHLTDIWGQETLVVGACPPPQG
jgi:hypothetical protein